MDDSRPIAIGALLYLNRKRRPAFLALLKRGPRTSKANSNLFLLSSILDYPISSKQALNNAMRLTDEIMGGREDVWKEVSKYTPSRWKSKWRAFGLHRFRAAHDRVHRIARSLMRGYSGDARELWRGQSPRVVSARLAEIDAGRRVSQMILMDLLESGMLKDEDSPPSEQNSAVALGRLIRGNRYRANEENEFASALAESSPWGKWLTSLCLSVFGQHICRPPEPLCRDCFLPQFCRYYQALYSHTGDDEEDKSGMRLSISRRTMLSYQRQLEKYLASQSPSAVSVDGDTILFTTPLSKPLGIGSYVVVTKGGKEQYICQITREQIEMANGPEFGIGLSSEGRAWIGPSTESSMRYQLGMRQLIGEGEVLGRLTEDCILPHSDPVYLHDAPIKLAEGVIVERYLSQRPGVAASIPVGISLNPNNLAKITLIEDGLSKPTLFCGQSRSGKTTALAILLERIFLFEKDALVVILDPNSDFVHINEMRPEPDVRETVTPGYEGYRYEEFRDAFEALRDRVKIFRPGALPDGHHERLAVDFSELSLQEKGMLLRLDPVDDVAEFEYVRQKLHSTSDLMDFVKQDVSNHASAEIELQKRIINLGTHQRESLEGYSENSCSHFVRAHKQRSTCLVYDIGSFHDRLDKVIASLVLINAIWNRRDAKRRVYLVVDEAHNISSPQPKGPFEGRINDVLIDIANEGSKYGLNLLLATQHPSRIHPDLLAACQNLVLLKLPAADLSLISETFSFIPMPLISRAKRFKAFESLVGGPIVRAPTFVRFEGRFLK